MAFISLRGSPDRWVEIVIFAVAVVGSLIARYWRFFAQRLDGIRGRDWGIVSASIDIVTVVVQTEETRYGERVVGYLATLTYFYRNPELQMGEYSRFFSKETEGQAWAALYKGRNVPVRVDPRDPARSVLRKEDL